MAEVEINPILCENNQLCFDICSEGVFEVDRGKVVVKNPENCNECFLCVETCPTGAVSID
jgi:NAD-dependent dihydropyrimidine dehydrogenase PreA subunit